MLVIPVAAVPSQTLNVILSGQSCTISLSQKSGIMYCTLMVGTETILSSVVCRDRVRIVRLAYLGFVGDLVFSDTSGVDDPIYTGLGSRFVFYYLEAADL